MKQKVKLIKIGNSVGFTLPANVREEAGLKLGDAVMVDFNSTNSEIIIARNDKKKKQKTTSTLTPEFYEWLKRFNARYKNALTELSKK